MPTRSDWLDAVHDSLWQQERFAFSPDRVLPAPQGTVVHGTGPRVGFCGFPSDFSLAFLLALLGLDVTVAGIVTSPRAHPAIRGQNALSQVADHVGVPLLRLGRVNEDESRASLTDLALDGMVMASFDQIVGRRALAIPRHGWLNVHPSPLPRYRGSEPVYWMIADGATEGGITLHRAVATFDAGPVLAQRVLPIDPHDDAGTLTRRLCEVGTAALGEAVTALLGDDPGTALDMSAATYRPSVGHRLLERAASATEAARMVRAGWPNLPAATRQSGAVRFVKAASVRVTGCDDDDLRFRDGCLHLDAVVERCSCADATPAGCLRVEA